MSNADLISTVAPEAIWQEPYKEVNLCIANTCQLNVFRCWEKKDTFLVWDGMSLFVEALCLMLTWECSFWLGKSPPPFSVFSQLVNASPVLLNGVQWNGANFMRHLPKVGPIKSNRVWKCYNLRSHSILFVLLLIGPVNRLGKWVILGDAAVLILKICMNKFRKIYSRQGAWRQKCYATLAPIQVIALLISLKSANSLLWLNFFTLNTFFMRFCKYTNSFRDLGKYIQIKVIN